MIPLRVALAFALVLCSAARTDAAMARRELPPLPDAIQRSDPSPALRALETATRSRWQVAWDPWTGVARSGRGGDPSMGATLSDREARDVASEHLRAHAALWGADGATLAAVRWEHSGHAWHGTWGQRVHGREVLGAHLVLTFAADGRLVAFHSTLQPQLVPRVVPPRVQAARDACADLLGMPVEIDSSEEIIVVEPAPGGVQALCAVRLALRGPFGARFLAVVESEHDRVLELQDLVRTQLLQGSSTGLVKGLYEHDPLVHVVFPWLLVRLATASGEDTTTSDLQGRFAFSTEQRDGLLRAALDGLYVSVDNQAVGGTSPRLEQTVQIPAEAALHWSAEHARDDERSIYYHTNLIHEFVKTRFGFTQLDFPLPAVAAVRNPASGDPAYANAFWDGQRMAFGNSGVGNFGLFADVVYHEYTHAITDYSYRPVGGLRGTIGAAIHEALSDYFACTITEDPMIGEYLGGTSGFRNLDNELVWPDDRDPQDEEHANGEILGGALWHLRDALGPEPADALVHFARDLFPQTFDEILAAILLQDDLLFGDGAAGNGSPHREQILSAFARHGIGPLAEREIRIEHQPLLDTEAVGVDRKVVAWPGAYTTGVVDGMRLHWSTGGTFHVESMRADAMLGFVATLPGQTDGTEVSYYLSAYRIRPYEERRLPAGAPQEVFTYRVGVDAEAPALVHTPLLEVPAFGWPPELACHIEDNLGLAYAYAEVWREGERVGTVGFVPSADEPNLFVARFPNVGGAVGEQFDYAITAIDASRAGNTARFPASGALGLQVVQDLAESFDVASGGWRHRAIVLARPDPWQLAGAFNHGTGSGRAWWCGGEGGEYPVQTAAELASAWFRVDGAARASIWSWIDAETNGPAFAFDGGIVQIQVEGQTSWDELVPLEGYTHTMSETGGASVLVPGTDCLSGRSNGWQQLHFDLGTWSGRRVRIRFLFGSDDVASPFALRGWLLDDFHLDAGEFPPTDAVDAAPLGSRLLARAPWPNPFTAELQFDLALPLAAGHVVLELLDVRGRIVGRLLDAEMVPGTRTLVWRPREEAQPLAAGVYHYRLTSALGRETGKLVLLE